MIRIYVDHQHDFTEDEMDFVLGLAEIGAISIEKARMYDHLKRGHNSLTRDRPKYIKLPSLIFSVKNISRTVSIWRFISFS